MLKFSIDFLDSLNPTHEGGGGAPFKLSSCKAAGGFARVGSDDIFAVGRKKAVMEAVKQFKVDVGERCGLSLQWSKTELFAWRGGLPTNSPPGATLAGRIVQGEFKRGFLCWGVPVGEKEYVESVLMEKVEQIGMEGRMMLEGLQEHKHAAWAALKWSVWARFEYWLQHCYPSVTIPAAEELDRQLWSLLETVFGFSIPCHGSLATRAWDCVLRVPLEGRQDWTFAAWLLRQPVKLGGLGLRSYAELCRPAFLGAVEHALPRLHKDFCPLLAPVVGGVESFGEEADSVGRWQVLLQSGSPCGREFMLAWTGMRQEAAEGARRGGDCRAPSI